MDNVFFVVSKIIWAFIQPDSWILLMILFALVAIWRGAKVWGLTALSMAIFFFLAIAIFPLGELVLRPLETRFPIYPELHDIDGIIILGGAEDAAGSVYWKQPQISNSAERIFEGVALARRFPSAKLVLTGGSGSPLNQPDTGNQADRGANVAEQIVSSLGIEEHRLVIEQNSRNTYENATHAYRLVQPAKAERWVLVTSASHMPRALGVFCQIGWQVTPYPVDFRSGAFSQKIGWDFIHNLDDLNTGTKEWVGLIAYWLTGKTSTLLADDC